MLLVFLVVVVVVVVVKEYREGSHIFSSSSSSSVRFHSSSSSWKNTEKGLGYQSFGFKKKKRGKFFSHFFFQKTREKRARVVPKTTDLIHEGSRVDSRLSRKRRSFFFPQVKGRALYLFSKKKKKKKKRHIFVRREEV